jgi:hypothetical protein
MPDDALRRAAYAQLCMVADALSLDDDRPFDELRADLLARLRAAWDKDGYRNAKVHEENANVAFLHATVSVLATDEVKKVWPYWRLYNPLDQRTSQLCDALANTVRPAGEAWWYDGRIPPLHFGGCRSLIEGLTLKEAHDIGVTNYYPVVQGDVHHGYGYGKPDFHPDLSKFPPELRTIYEKAVSEDGKGTAAPVDEEVLLIDLLVQAVLAS